MGWRKCLLSRSPRIGTYAESSGFYERVPIRVGEFALIENEREQIVFRTTSTEFCEEGPPITVRITAEDGWSVEAQQGAYNWSITPSVDLHTERLARRRACWHAVQYMRGADLSHAERFSLIHREHNDDASLFDDDAFFRHGDAVTRDPFGPFLDQ